MDWKVLTTTFGLIFLAEIGDKTQLTAMTLASQTRRPYEVLLAASVALALVSALGIAVGTLLSSYLPLDWIKRISAVAFIAVGVLILLGKL